MASGHDNLVLEPLTMASNVKRVLHVTVFYAYGAEKIYMHQMETSAEASIQFQSREDAKYARKTFHGRNIYNGCCRMDIHLEGLLHQVFYAYGAEKIYMHQMETSAEASIQFQSREDAKYARKTFHGRNIYNGCCRMDIHLELLSPAATSSNSASTAPFS
uniref:PTBP1-like RNA recognition motif 2 domain-containing protein n=1 Tax=Oryza barthii TaxID=65489 RepID=A0A0D3HU69_9ORYZ